MSLNLKAALGALWSHGHDPPRLPLQGVVVFAAGQLLSGNEDGCFLFTCCVDETPEAPGELPLVSPSGH